MTMPRLCACCEGIRVLRDDVYDALVYLGVSEDRRRKAMAFSLRSPSAWFILTLTARGDLYSISEA